MNQIYKAEASWSLTKHRKNVSRLRGTKLFKIIQLGTTLLSTGKSLSIRPIEEVMEEDSFSRSGSMTNIMGQAESNAMEVDDSQIPQQQVNITKV